MMYTQRGPRRALQPCMNHSTEQTHLKSIKDRSNQKASQERKRPDRLSSVLLFLGSSSHSLLHCTRTLKLFFTFISPPALPCTTYPLLLHKKIFSFFVMLSLAHGLSKLSSLLWGAGYCQAIPLNGLSKLKHPL